MTEIKFDITEEQVQLAVKSVVREEMAAISDYRGIRAMVEDAIGSAADAVVQNELGGRLAEIADGVLEEHMSKPFTLTDGWGCSERSFDRYEEFVRFKLRELFKKEDYSLKREFEKRMQKKVDKVWDEYRDDAINKAMAKVEALKAVE